MTRIPGSQIPQPPRFAVQRLAGDRWEMITFDDRGPEAVTHICGRFLDNIAGHMPLSR
jgi:hypothetical protein